MSAISNGCWSAAGASIWSAGRRPTPIFPCSKSSPGCAMPSREPWPGSKSAIRALSACTIRSGNSRASPRILLRTAAFPSTRWAFSGITRNWTSEAGAADSKHVSDIGGTRRIRENRVPQILGREPVADRQGEDVDDLVCFRPDEVGSENAIAVFFDQHLESVDAFRDAPGGVPIRGVFLR